MKINNKIVFILALVFILTLFAYIFFPTLKTEVEPEERHPINESEEIHPINISSKNPIALVYRGPAAGCSGCSEAVATLLGSNPKYNFSVIYVGPEEKLSVQDGLKLKNVVLYAQPGGDGIVDKAYKSMSSDAAAIRSFVQNGGRYLGFCMGGYLVDDNPGFGLGLNTGRYISSPDATVTTDKESLALVSWRGKPRAGCFFKMAHILSLTAM